MNGQPGRQVAQDAVNFPAFSVLKRKNFIVEPDGFLRLDKRGFAAVAFAMQDTFYLPLVFGKKCHHPTAIKEGFFRFSNKTSLIKLSYDPVKKTAEFVPLPDQRHPDICQFRRCFVTHLTVFFQDLVDKLYDGLFVITVLDNRGES